jgi:hypothetical protein
MGSKTPREIVRDFITSAKAVAELKVQAEVAERELAKWPGLTRVTLRYLTGTIKREPKEDWRGDWFGGGIGAAGAVIVGVTLFFGQDAPDVWPGGVAAGVVALAMTAYLLALLRAVVRHCEGNVVMPWVPYRPTAVFIAILTFSALVMSFAELNGVAHLGTQSTDRYAAFYDALITNLTFNHGHYENPDGLQRFLVVWQLLTSVLSVIVFWPLLVSRLAMFPDDGSAERPAPGKMTVEGSEEAEVVVSDGKTEAILTGKREITVTRDGQIIPSDWKE